MPDFPPIVILFLAAKAAPRYSVRLIPFGERGWAFTTIDNCTKNVRRFRTDEQGQGLYRLVGADEQNDHDANRLIVEWQKVADEKSFCLPKARHDAHRKLHRLLIRGYFIIFFS